jgi:hypothetical protein
MPNLTKNNKRWRRNQGAFDTRMALLLVELEERAKAAKKTYDDRLEALFSRADYDRLFDAWEAGQEAPADLGAIMEADPTYCEAWDVIARTLWALSGITHNGIPSEHYVYQQTGGKLTGPNGEK